MSAATRVRSRRSAGFFLDLAGTPTLKTLFLDQEHHDGYFRDRCVFRPDIDIEDSMSVIVGYDNGTLLTYSLNTFNAWEGYTVVFNGTKGRIEHTIVEGVYVNGTDTVQGGNRGRRRDHTGHSAARPARASSRPGPAPASHGGGDHAMLKDAIFLPVPPVDKYLRASDERGGAASDSRSASRPTAASRPA